METNRYKYTIIVALALAHETAIFGREICKRITSRYGGCSQSEGTGYWAEDGDKDLTVYGKPMVEYFNKVEVVTVDKSRDALKALVHLAAKTVREDFDLKVKGQWIHFEEIPLYCEHFEI